MLTAFGIAAAATMVTSYALEERHQRWTAVFAFGCLATAVYGLLTGAWIFVLLETLWAGVAVQKFRRIAVTA